MELIYKDWAIQSYLSELAEGLFPEEFARMVAAREKTSWVANEINGQTAAAILEQQTGKKIPANLFEGRVTLWKLQTGIHVDALDYLCAIYCSGQFVGGEGIFTDLNLKLA